MNQNHPKYTQFTQLPASLKAAPKGHNTNAVDANEVIDVTLRLCRKQSIEEALKQGIRMSREEYANTFGSSDEAVAAVEDFAHHFGLTIVETDKARRSVMLTGKTGDFEKAFQVYLSKYRDDKGNSYRGRTGYIKIPKELEKYVEGVFGLDNRPHANPLLKVAQNDGIFLPHTSSQGYTPNEIGKAYGFPSNVNGAGQCIALIELGGGLRTSDINQYFTSIGLQAPSITAISVDGAHSAPSVADSADGEVMLDIEVAGSIAPGAKMVVYFAPNTDKGFLDAITKAIHDNVYKPTVISISWGSAEKNWTAQSMTSFNEAFKAASILGVTICIAAGDSGSSDGLQDGKVHVDFPASSPYALSCGGTKLVTKNNIIVSEVVWHESANSAGGGGVSEFFPIPAYQNNAKVPVSINASKFKGRGVPDVAGNADPATGYKVLVDGQAMVIGGTSAVAPLYAGLIALLNQQKGTTAGFVNPILYTTPALCRDIVQGTNTTENPSLGYKAGAGWDACTGLGVFSKLNA